MLAGDYLGPCEVVSSVESVLLSIVVLLSSREDEDASAERLALASLVNDLLHRKSFSYSSPNCLYAQPS